MNNFLDSSMLEMALGLIFIYFLLSIICSSVNEFLAGLMKWRARDLERGVLNLIRDPDLARKVLNNPLIVALSSQNTEPVLVKLVSGNKKVESDRLFLKNTIAQSEAAAKEPIRKNYASKPSYISARTFVLALLDTLADGDLDIQSIRDAATELVGQTKLANGDPRPDTTPKDPQQEALGKTLLMLLDDSKSGCRLVIGLEDIRHIVEALPDSTDKTQVLNWITTLNDLNILRDRILTLDETSTVRRTIINALSIGLSEIEAFKLRVENWYDNTMEHVSGVYKRRMQIYLFGIGLLVAVVVGADSIRIATLLSSNAAVRQALIADVSKATTPEGEFYFNPTMGSDPASANTDSTISTTVITSTPVLTDSKATGVTKTTTVSLPNTQKVVDEINHFGQLFGYDSFWSEFRETDLWRNTGLLAGKVLGLIVTAFAITFGAPFWFDLLNKVSNLRAGVKPTGTKSGA